MAKSIKRAAAAGGLGGILISSLLSGRRKSDDRSFKHSETREERHDRHCNEREDLVADGEYAHEACLDGRHIYLLDSGKWVYKDGEIAHPRQAPMRPPQVMPQAQPQPCYGPPPAQMPQYPSMPYQQPTYAPAQARPSTWYGPPNAGITLRPPPPTGLAASYYNGSDVSTPPLRRSRPAHGSRRSSSTDASYF